MIKFFRLIAKHMAVLTLTAAIVAFFLPDLFTPFKHIFKELFAATMFSLGIVLNREDLMLTVRRPLRIALGVITQFIIMPLLAFTIVMLSGISPSLALGFIIVGSAPGAMASNVIVYLAGGALAFSISLTTVATFLAPILTPYLISLLGGETIPVNAEALMWTIFYILVIPLSGGMLFRYYLDKGYVQTVIVAQFVLAAIILQLFASLSGYELWKIGLISVFLLWLPLCVHLLPRRFAPSAYALAKEISPAIAALAIIVICAYGLASNKTKILEVGAWVFVLVIVLNLLGYLSGWWLAKLYRFDLNHRITLTIEIGMQNAGLGVALALEHFKAQPEVALPGALFAVWSVITAAGASAYFRHKNARLQNDSSQNHFAQS